MYTSAPLQSVDPLLASLGTQSPQPLRFHACERRWKCDQVWSKGIGSYEFSEENLPTLRGKGKKLKKVGEGEEVGGGKTVFVNPWSMSRKRWEEYKGRVTKALVGEEGFDGVEVLGKRLRGEGESALPDFLVSDSSNRSTLVRKLLIVYAYIRSFHSLDIQLYQNYNILSPYSVLKLFTL